MPLRAFMPDGRIWFLLFVFFYVTSCVAQDTAPEVTTESVFAATPFDQWMAEAPKEQIPWHVHTSVDGLSFHQRLAATILVRISGNELMRRVGDGGLTLLVQVTNTQGNVARNYGLLELEKVTREIKHGDLEFSWQAFASPGEYKLDIALWDKKSGERNLQHRHLHVPPYKNDPLPDMWRELDPFEFWAPLRTSPELIFHSDIDGKLNLALATKRPLQLHLLLDMSPSSEIYHGDYAPYNDYLSVAVPVFKVFSQISLAHGSIHEAAMELVQRHLVFEQDDGKALDWSQLRTALLPDSGPGLVSVKDLQARGQSPVFLREEIVRRLNEGVNSSSGQTPLRVFVVIGGPMDLYQFPALPEIESARQNDCIIYYVQLQFFDPGITGAANSVEKMLRPLKVRTFKVQSPGEARQALAKILDELGKM